MPRKGYHSRVHLILRYALDTTQWMTSEALNVTLREECIMFGEIHNAMDMFGAIPIPHRIGYAKRVAP